MVWATGVHLRILSKMDAGQISKIINEEGNHILQEVHIFWVNDIQRVLKKF